MSDLVVEKCGSDQWPRYAIKDADNHYWSGSEWSNPEKAMIFNEEHEALRTAIELTLNTKLRLFTANFTVIVEGKQSVDVEDLRRYLNSNCKVLLGDKTFKDMKLSVDIEWESLEEA